MGNVFLHNRLFGWKSGAFHEQGLVSTYVHTTSKDIYIYK